MSVYDDLVSDGLLRKATKGELSVYSYTQSVVVDRAWSEMTMKARGIVLRGDAVIANPFPKFFNYYEPGVKMPSGPAEIMKKHDGSLIIVFWSGDSWDCCTRGCFDNPQTRAAQEWLDSECRLDRLVKGDTYLFELVAPWNRIVTPYDEEEMILIGHRGPDGSPFDACARDLADTAARIGAVPCDYHIGDPRNIDLDGDGYEEGFVARWGDRRIKFKYVEYLRLHKLLTGMSAKVIHQRTRDGLGAPECLPDEFYQWYESVRIGFESEAEEIIRESRELFDDAPMDSRKSFADYAKKHRHSAILFRMLDGRPFDDLVYKLIRWEVGKTFAVQTAGASL